MSWLDAFLIYIATILSLLTVVTVCYCYWFRHRLQKLIKKVPTARSDISSISDVPAVARYSEYKNRYGSRTREIAVISANKQQSNLDHINEFVETMREHGSLLYHFTNYWGNSSVKHLQEQADSIMRGNYHAVVALGLSSTKLMKYASLNHGKNIPIVFGCIRDTWWHNEQKKKAITTMTGVTVSSGWSKRIALYHAVKPDMRNALLPLTSVNLQSDLNEISQLLQDRGVTPHAVKIHDAPEMLNVLNHFQHKIDSLICLQDNLTPSIAPKIATACANNGITYFSPYSGDTLNGAAVSVNAPNIRIGWHMAQKMIDLLEEFKTPAEIPITNIGCDDYPYEARFNQHAMKAQGIDPAILATLAMQYGTSVHVTVNRRRTNGA